MKVAIIEIPYPVRLVLPMDQLNCLTHHLLVKSEGYGRDRRFTVADPAGEKIEIKVVDESEIASFAPPEPAPAPVPVEVGGAKPTEEAIRAVITGNTEDDQPF